MNLENVFEELNRIYEAVAEPDIFDEVMGEEPKKPIKRTVRYFVYENGRNAGDMKFTEVEDAECTAEVQFIHWFRTNPMYQRFARNPKAFTYQRVSRPEHPGKDRTGNLSEFNFSDRSVDGILKRAFKGLPIW